MKVLIVCATVLEWKPVYRQLINAGYQEHAQGTLHKGHLEIAALVAGVGSTATALALGHQFAMIHPDLALQIGIAGSYSDQLSLGEVVHVVSDCFADLGVEEQDGTFLTVYEAGIQEVVAKNHQVPWLYQPGASDFGFLVPAKAITVNTVSGCLRTIAMRREKFNPDIESMEGAAFFIACLKFNVPFLQLRAISNRVEPRDKNNWNIPLALDNLGRSVLEMLNSLANT